MGKDVLVLGGQKPKPDPGEPKAAWEQEMPITLPPERTACRATEGSLFVQFSWASGSGCGSNRKRGLPVSEQGWHCASCSGAWKLTPVTREGTLGHSPPRPPRLLAQPAKQSQVRRKVEGHRSSIKIYFEHVCVEGAS